MPHSYTRYFATVQKQVVREFRHSSKVASVVKTQSYNTLMALTAPSPRKSPYRK